MQVDPNNPSIQYSSFEIQECGDGKYTKINSNSGCKLVDTIKSIFKSIRWKLFGPSDAEIRDLLRPKMPGPKPKN